MLNTFICHDEKYQKQDVANMENHNLREQLDPHKNIDISRSNQNYHIPGVGANFSERDSYHDRISAIIASERKGPISKVTGKPKKIRDNTVVMVTAVVTASAEYMRSLSADEQMRYFACAAEWIKRETGERNAIDAVVHMDESNPHMHYSYVPITQDGRLCANDCHNPSFLRKLQADLPQYLRSQGFDVQRGEEGSGAKHITTAEMRADGRRKREEMERRERIRGLKAEAERLEDLARKGQAVHTQAKSVLERSVNAAVSAAAKAKEAQAKAKEEAEGAEAARVKRAQEEASLKAVQERLRQAQDAREREERQEKAAREKRRQAEAEAAREKGNLERLQAEAERVQAEREQEEAKKKAEHAKFSFYCDMRATEERKLEAIRQDYLALQGEVSTLRQERDTLAADNATQKERADKIRTYIDKHKPYADAIQERNRMERYLRDREASPAKIHAIKRGEHVAQR